jgi:SAM-dependent methyltransferase
MSEKAHIERFNKDYYERYYLNRATRVATPGYYKRLAKFLAAYSGFLEVPVLRVLDLGCGIGGLKAPLQEEFKSVDYVGVEYSQHACEKYGWEQGCASSYSSPQAYDLVICHDVLQYLDGERADAALRNFARLTTKILYFSVLTKEDWHHHVDQHLTDDDVSLRPASWYRKRLVKKFRNLGGGVYLDRKNEAVVYTLEGEP